jgi:hypothetical protein
VDGTAGQVLAIDSLDPLVTEWVTGGGGGGAVDSVNGATGVVVLDADDIDDAATTNKFATAAQLSAVDDLATTYQPLDADLTSIAALSTTAFGRGLLEQADAATARTTLGLGTIATQAANSVAITGGAVTGITDITVADGGTGRSTSTTAYGIIAAGTTATGAHQTISPGTSGQVLRSNGASALATFQALTITNREVVTFPSAVAQGDNASAWVCPATGTLVSVDIWCDTAPVTAAVTVDLHKNGTTVFTTQGNRPSIATSATTDTSGTVEVTPMTAGDKFQFQIDSLNASDEGNIGQLMCRFSWTETIT